MSIGSVKIGSRGPISTEIQTLTLIPTRRNLIPHPPPGNPPGPVPNFLIWPLAQGLLGLLLIGLKGRPHQ